MGPGLEDDLLILRERSIDIHRNLIEVAEGRHGTQLAVGKQACELSLSRKSDRMCGEDSPQTMEVHIPTCR